MSMKHEYKVGQEVYVKGNDHEPWLSDGDKVMITHLDNQGAIINCDGGITSIDLSDLSPYPPVKAVDGWAVVKKDEIIEIRMIMNKPDINWLGYHGYRCIKGRFIPDNDNS